MITDENKKLAQWAMDYALKNGCQAAKVLLYSSSNTSFELRDAKMDRLQQASEGGLSLSLYVDGRYGSISTNRLNRKELETFIKNGIDSTRYLAKDEARVLADPSRYYKGGKPDLKLYDAKFASLNPDDKIEMAKARSGRSTRQGRTDHLCRFFLWRWRGLCLPPDQQWFRRRNQKYVVLTFCRHHDQRGRRGASFCLLV